jgi:hypothetical protein
VSNTKTNPLDVVFGSPNEARFVVLKGVIGDDKKKKVKPWPNTVPGTILKSNLAVKFGQEDKFWVEVVYNAPVWLAKVFVNLTVLSMAAALPFNDQPPEDKQPLIG